MMPTPTSPRRRAARERVAAARTTASILLEQRKREVQRDLDERMRELDGKDPVAVEVA